RRLADLEAQRRRFHQERISLQIHITDDPRIYQQMFVDINDTALGVGSTLRVRYDRRKVVNRAVDILLDTPMLVNLVDMERDRTTGTSPYWLSVKHLADIVRTIAVGISGRISRRQEGELKDRELAEDARMFLILMGKGFPEIQELSTGEISPQVLRGKSLLGSTSFLKVLAGVYHEIRHDVGMEDIREFFYQLSPHLTVPIPADSRILGTGTFEVGASAPMGRRQDLQRSVNVLTYWAKTRPGWMCGEETPPALGTSQENGITEGGGSVETKVKADALETEAVQIGGGRLPSFRSASTPGRSGFSSC
ncbi:MAG TPA: DNA sulfur modification protein DndB, partial [Chloroflexota bacterium]|nr:DNA sulfur modification protein DndB [Chloroflexota bacterium]